MRRFTTSNGNCPLLKINQRKSLQMPLYMGWGQSCCKRREICGHQLLTFLAQLEKEALALTWACERFILGLHFKLETDHTLLVSLLGGQALDALPPRIQRFRMRLMSNSYTIKHIPGKSLTTAVSSCSSTASAPKS